ncbi:unnamed protein product [Adineta steineri]|uniref:Apple domain-containing protein n=1 Tax=Adineta steineri TaxID=433720 RepID=A0A813V829_9BILA|nr:unnamed protein product [Adineta steineri]CAF0940609.1 unnamed protein product [Adineta steineri]
MCDSIIVGTINNSIMIGTVNKSLLNVTKDECICEMMKINVFLLSGLNYFSTNRSCELFYSNNNSIVIEYNNRSYHQRQHLPLHRLCHYHQQLPRQLHHHHQLQEPLPQLRHHHQQPPPPHHHHQQPPPPHHHHQQPPPPHHHRQLQGLLLQLRHQQPHDQQQQQPHHHHQHQLQQPLVNNPWICSNMTVLQQKDMPGNDMSNQQSVNYTQCCILCLSMSGCRGFVWGWPNNTDSFQQSHCWLKSTLVAPISATQFTCAHF